MHKSLFNDKLPAGSWLFIFLLLITGSVFGQDVQPINTDRPDQSDGVYTLPKKMFQLETGLLYGDFAGNYFLHNTMLRYGFFNKTEIRLEFDYGRQYGTTGILPLNLSVKQNLVEQRGVLPAITAIANISLPFLSSPAFTPDKVPAGLTFAFENELSDHFSSVNNCVEYPIQRVKKSVSNQ